MPRPGPFTRRTQMAKARERQRAHDAKKRAAGIPSRARIRAAIERGVQAAFLMAADKALAAPETFTKVIWETALADLMMEEVLDIEAAKASLRYALGISAIRARKASQQAA